MIKVENLKKVYGNIKAVDNIPLLSGHLWSIKHVHLLAEDFLPGLEKEYQVLAISNVPRHRNLGEQYQGNSGGYYRV